jgi:diguanylate cyclase (GGDEF)-like protein
MKTWVGVISRFGNFRPLFFNLGKRMKTTGGDTWRLAQENILLNTEINRLKEENALLREQSLTDHLTGLCNRHGAHEHSLRLFSCLERREMSSVTFLWIDMDHFKQFNDRHGHEAGDGLLRRMAHILRESFRRPSDIVCRLGGDEFLVLLVNQAKGDSLAIAESLRSRVKKDFSEEGITVSIGILRFSLEGHGRLGLMENHAAWMKFCLTEADAALYESKRKGRDSVTVIDPY